MALIDENISISDIAAHAGTDDRGRKLFPAIQPESNEIFTGMVMLGTAIPHLRHRDSRQHAARCLEDAS